MKQITFLQDFAVHKQGATISIDGMTATSLIKRGIAVYADNGWKDSAIENYSELKHESEFIPIEEKSTEVVEEAAAAKLPKQEPVKVLSVKQHSKTSKKNTK